MALSPEDLDREYRAALRREVQLRQEKQDLEEVLLRTKGKFLMIIQQIDMELQHLARESDRHATANEVSQIKGYPLGAGLIQPRREP